MTKANDCIIGFGVIDSKYKNRRWTDLREKNIILYYGHNGSVYGNGKGFVKWVGNGLNEGQIVTVRVDREKG